MNILNNYSLTFINKKLVLSDGETMNRKTAVHDDSTGYLGYFLNVVKDPGDIDDVITNINVIISEGFYDPEYNFDIGIRKDLFMEHTNISVKFYNKFGGDFLQEIPFDDFKEILQLWKTFNQTPPLHNQLL